MAAPEVKTGAGLPVRYAWFWLPFAFYWAALVLLDRGSMSAAFVAGVVMTLAAIVLSAGVWWLSGRHPWSSSRVSLWLLRQAGYAFIFSATLALLEAGLRATAAGRGFGAEVAASPVTLARGLLVYTWLFGLVAGVCYAARAHLRLRAEALLSAQAEAAASRAQLQALRAQLNPHFLFNALHSVAALVRERPAAAEEAVERLGEMLRYALDDGAEEEVLLSEEWAFTEDYLALEALRYGERLRLQTSVSREALSCAVPAFVLQPLVENAVRHGIAPRLGGGRLVVRAAVMAGELEIEVRDDGPGAPRVDEAGRRGVGLRAVEERLLSRHPGRARMEVTTAPGTGYTVKLRLPARIRVLEATA
jgi:signal transduction histidine kinase